jgi:DNA-binding transcriptional LysR family regulator
MMSPMQIETLRIFCEVARSRSFSRGAEANHVTQSAASQAIGLLEKRLSVVLIDRSRRPLLLTPEGQAYFEHCDRMLRDFDEAESRIRLRRLEPSWTVNVAAIYSAGFQDMTRHVEKFRDQMPNSVVDIAYLRPDEVYDRLRDDRADLGIVSFPPASRDWQVLPWRREPMVVICPPWHVLADKATIDPQELTRQKLICYSKGLPIRKATDRFLRSFGITVQPHLEIDNLDTIKSAVTQGQGIAIVPEPTVRPEVRAGILRTVPLSGQPFERPVCIIHRRRRPLSPAVDGFLRVLTETAESGRLPAPSFQA